MERKGGQAPVFGRKEENHEEGGLLDPIPATHHAGEEREREREAAKVAGAGATGGHREATGCQRGTSCAKEEKGVCGLDPADATPSHDTHRERIRKAPAWPPATGQRAFGCPLPGRRQFESNPKWVL